MQPVEFKEQNFISSDLPTFKGKDDKGRDIIITKWVFTPEEMKAIMAGKFEGIYLMTLSEGLSPVLLQTQNPFAQTPTLPAIKNKAK